MPLIKLTVNLLAQITHVIAGLSVIAVAFWFSRPWWFGLVAILIGETFKEVVFDPLAEGHPNGWIAKWKEGAVDEFFWFVGAGGGFILAYIYMFVK